MVITTQLSGLKADLRRLMGLGLQCQEHKLQSPPGSAAVELMQDLLAHSPAAQLAGTLLAKLAECLGGYPLALHQASGLLRRCQDLTHAKRTLKALRTAADGVVATAIVMFINLSHRPAT